MCPAGICHFLSACGLMVGALAHCKVSVNLCVQVSLCYSVIFGQFSKETQHRRIGGHEGDTGTPLALSNCVSVKVS